MPGNRNSVAIFYQQAIAKINRPIKTRSVALDIPHSETAALLGLGSKSIPVRFVRKRQARRYVLRVKAGGIAQVTIPAGGSIDEALVFARRHQYWIEKQLEKLAQAKRQPWTAGATILFRGEPVRLSVEPNGSRFHIRFANHGFALRTPSENGRQPHAEPMNSLCPSQGEPAQETASEPARLPSGEILDLRPSVSNYLRSLAELELPPRAMLLAQQHQLPVRRVTVRDQHSRWGSCSVRGTISLNWRLIQTPQFVSDYIVLHELMHLKEMNHSARFWQLVQEVCPNYETAERWLKVEGRQLI